MYTFLFGKKSFPVRVVRTRTNLVAVKASMMRPSGPVADRSKQPDSVKRTDSSCNETKRHDRVFVNVSDVVGDIFEYKNNANRTLRNLISENRRDNEIKSWKILKTTETVSSMECGEEKIHPQTVFATTDCIIEFMRVERTKATANRDLLKAFSEWFAILFNFRKSNSYLYRLYRRNISN